MATPTTAPINWQEKTFVSSDGYCVRFDASKGLWTDGDMFFHPREDGWPLDSWEEPVEGNWQ